MIDCTNAVCMQDFFKHRVNTPVPSCISFVLVYAIFHYLIVYSHMVFVSSSSLENGFSERVHYFCIWNWEFHINVLSVHNRILIKREIRTYVKPITLTWGAYRRNKQYKAEIQTPTKKLGVIILTVIQRWIPGWRQLVLDPARYFSLLYFRV